MAKKPKKPKKQIPGPLLAVAVFCEQTVEDIDKSISIVKLADTATFHLPADAPIDLPSKEKPLPVTIRGLISFKRGGARGKWHRLKLTIQGPTGNRTVVSDKRVPLQPQPWASVNTRIEMVLGVSQSGVFWMIVEFDGKEYTRIPLQVLITREATTAGGQSKRQRTTK